MRIPLFLIASMLIGLGTGPAWAVPIVSGDGQGSESDTGSFGETGSIFEYGLRAGAGLFFTSTQIQSGNQLLLSYAFTALTPLGGGSAAVFLDGDINRDANTWFNERGEVSVAAGGADSWEIDEPGFGAVYVGDIFSNFLTGSFDNSVFNGQTNLAEDVALGLGFVFGDLAAGDRLLLEILISESAIGPGWGTVLRQWDGDDGQQADNLYLAGRYQITPAVPPVDAIPEPGPLVLMGIGIVGAVYFSRRRA
jgi:hypothetical protein